MNKSSSKKSEKNKKKTTASFVLSEKRNFTLGLPQTPPRNFCLLLKSNERKILGNI